MGDIKRRQAAAASGRFVVRLDPGLHAALRQAAAQAGTSLNEYCARKLAAPVGSLAHWQGGSDTVTRAAALFGEDLVGVVVFGSWARGEQRPSSDVDILVVIDQSLPVSRGLYREWDVRPLTWDGHRVEPHFVHLPPAMAAVAGLWAEVAMDGVLLFSRGQGLHARLAAIRGDIAAGRIVRRLAQGQPYWVRAA